MLQSMDKRLKAFYNYRLEELLTQYYLKTYNIVLSEGTDSRYLVEYELLYFVQGSKVQFVTKSTQEVLIEVGVDGGLVWYSTYWDKVAS